MPKIMETDIIWKGKGNNWGILIEAHITQWFRILCRKTERKKSLYSLSLWQSVASKGRSCLKEEPKLPQSQLKHAFKAGSTPCVGGTRCVFVAFSLVCLGVFWARRLRYLDFPQATHLYVHNSPPLQTYLLLPVNLAARILLNISES